MTEEFDLEKVKYLAQLARLELSAEETRSFSHQLAAIVEYFHKLEEVDITDVPPANMLDIFADLFREDIPRTTTSTDEFLAVVPRSQPPFVRVPAVFETEES